MTENIKQIYLTRKINEIDSVPAFWWKKSNEFIWICIMTWLSKRKNYIFLSRRSIFWSKIACKCCPDWFFLPNPWIQINLDVSLTPPSNRGRWILNQFQVTKITEKIGLLTNNSKFSILCFLSKDRFIPIHLILPVKTQIEINFLDFSCQRANLILKNIESNL